MAPASTSLTMTDNLTLPVWVWVSHMMTIGCATAALLVWRPQMVPGLDPWLMTALAVGFLFAPLVITVLVKRRMNQLRKDEAGVSPVIGVILMVAITVVLAAVVWVLVQNLGTGPVPVPTMSLQTDDQGDTFQVIAADTGLDWSDFTAAPCTTVPTGPVLAGQELAGCSGQVQLVHVPTNRLLYSYG